jgi:hypothetical protein
MASVQEPEGFLLTSNISWRIVPSQSPFAWLHIKHHITQLHLWETSSQASLLAFLSLYFFYSKFSTGTPYFGNIQREQRFPWGTNDHSFNKRSQKIRKQLNWWELACFGYCNREEIYIHINSIYWDILMRNVSHRRWTTAEPSDTLNSFGNSSHHWQTLGNILDLLQTCTVQYPEFLQTQRCHSRHTHGGYVVEIWIQSIYIHK